MNVFTEGSDFGRGFRYLLIFITVCFLVLLGRLVQLQLLEGRKYADQARDLYLKRIVVKARRGIIKDRLGRVLVDNEVNFNVYIVPRFFTPAAFEKLKRYLSLDDERVDYIRTKIVGALGDKRWFALLAVPAITRDQRERIESNQFELPGVRVIKEWKRRYPYGNLAAHVLGYLNEVSGKEIRRLRHYRIGDKIGRFGVERQWEWYLRGKPGYQRYIVNVRGKRQTNPSVTRLLGPKHTWQKAPQPGYNLVLNIDLELQRIVEQKLRWHRSGAAVVVEVDSGRILAMASKPSFDPAMLSARLTVEQARQLYDNPYHPMLDKTLMGSYFPGSTYKVIVAMAALEERLVDTSEYIFCKKFHEYGRKSAFRCTSKHGPINFDAAIVRSCNIYFYNMGERVGMNRISRVARDFGLGTPTGLGLNGERGGFIPTKAWYAKYMPGGFRIGHTLNAAVGQGNVTVTPLQLAMLYATIANGGKLYLPLLVDRVETPDGKTAVQFHPQLRRRVQVSDTTLRRIRNALKGVVQDVGGTAHEAWIPSVDAAGKTGTAQVIKQGKKRRDPADWWRFEDHAWFAAYAPTDKPEIAVVVLIEHGGSAGKNAAPVVMRIIRDYMAKVKGRQRAKQRRARSRQLLP